MLQSEIDQSKQEWERGLAQARDRNAIQAAALRNEAADWMKMKVRSYDQDQALERARRASRRTAWLDSYLAALKAGKPLPQAPRSIFGADELKYMSAHGCPVEVTP